MSLSDLKKELKRHGSKGKAKTLRGFFKTGPGEYGEGDVFVGVTVPQIRVVVRKYKAISLKNAVRLLQSRIHEERLTSLLILVLKYSQSDDLQREKIYDLYLKHSRYINNWDLVDLTAAHIVGAFLSNKGKQPLYALAQSQSLWERRISIVSTFYYIRNNKFKETLKIAHILIADKEDLIQKAVGWMLREVGKRDLSTEENFLVKFYKRMPRTMLRYAIERFPESKRQAYLKGRV